MESESERERGKQWRGARRETEAADARPRATRRRPPRLAERETRSTRRDAP